MPITFVIINPPAYFILKSTRVQLKLLCYGYPFNNADLDSEHYSKVNTTSVNKYVPRSCLRIYERVDFQKTNEKTQKHKAASLMRSNSLFRKKKQ